MGLSRYGAGDLDGALLLWEEALAIDPDNAQANSYVDYVRLHYEMVGRGDPEVTPGDAAPFGIQEEPEYQIEILPGELDARDSKPALANETVEEGWFDDEATRDVAAGGATVPMAGQDLPLDPDLPQLSLEGDEPSEPISLELEAEPPPRSEVNFDDATREYYGTRTESAAPDAPADFSDSAGTKEYRQDSTGQPSPGSGDFREEYTGGFGGESTQGFSSQETGVRKRDLGFVQPVSASEPVKDTPSSPLSIGQAPTMDSISLAEATQERPSFARAPNEDELLASLPQPRPTHAPSETQDIPIVASKVVTRRIGDTNAPPSTKAVTKELPDARRPPARRDSTDLSQAEVVLRHAQTQDFDPRKIDITAPTRELGLRPPPARPATLPDPHDEDAPTTQSDVRAIRDAAARDASDTEEGTRDDIALPFDPIEARAAQILDEVDAEAPADESREDQTRRRIAALLERALAWNDAGDTERAVCAVDLALSEDPNSALGQKLITRHREAIMSVFAGYIGDLDRMPQLARPLHELQDAPISPRAAFLLSRIDGVLTVDELLDVSGMPRLEAFRHICQLYLRGILR